MLGHRALRRLLHRLRIAFALRLPFGERPALRQIAVDRIVRRGLIGDDIGPHAAADKLRKNLRRVAEHADRERLSLAAGALDHLQAPRRGLSPAHRGSRSSAASRCGSAGTRPRASMRRPWSRRAAARRPCRRGRRSGSSGRRGRPDNAGGRPRRRSRRCPERCPGCRYRSTSRRSSGRTSSGRGDRARGNAPRSPSAARGWNWRSARAARRHACEKCRPACRTGRAASDRPRAFGARRRCGQSSPSRARRARCRHRRQARPAARRPPGRGCSSACEAALRSARIWRRFPGRAARGCFGRCRCGSWRSQSARLLKGSSARDAKRRKVPEVLGEHRQLVSWMRSRR